MPRTTPYGRPPGRSLSDEEKRLWHYVTRHDQPLHPRAHDKDVILPVVSSAPAPRLQAQDTSPGPVARRQPEPVAISLGAYAGIDRNTAERFRRGDYPLDGTLDLHGMSREKAHIALMGFLRSHHERASRCLLVITGKGQRPSNETEQRVVLREMLPRWLGEPGLQPLVLAFDTAQQKHGGSGAYYILLRRKR